MSVIEPFTPRNLGPKDWGTERLVAHTAYYTGKVLYMNKGASGPLQYHEHKDETFYLFSGEAIVEFGNGDGGYEKRRMYAGESYHVPPGAVHRVEAVIDCVFFEASLPVFDDRVAVHP